MQHTQSEQITIRSAIHQPFLQLQAVDLPFDLAVTLCRREGGTYCCIVPVNPLGKAFQLGNATLFGLEKPSSQVSVSTFS
jgi:hypothetical protein